MILNTEQLEQKARELALTHSPTRGSKRAVKELLQTFNGDVEGLRIFVRYLQRTHSAEIQPAEEWLLDHADFIEEQAIGIRQEIVKSEMHRLPVVGDKAELRAYAVCRHYFEHTDGVLDFDTFTSYTNAYQEVAVLAIAEVWALPLLIKISLIRRLAAQMQEVRQRREAGRHVDRLLAPLEGSRPDPAALREALDRSGAAIPLSGPVIVHLVQRLGEWADHAGEIKDWLTCRLENGTESLEQIITYEHRLQASYQVTAGNCIQSVRKTVRLEWTPTFERLCYADRTMRKETTGIYARLDASSRSVLLERIETLSRRLGVPESLVAERAIKLADHHASAAPDPDGSGSREDEAAGNQAGGPAELGATDHVRDHVTPRPSFAAYFLLDPAGVRSLWKELQTCAKPRNSKRAAVRRHRGLAYFGTLAVFFLAVFALTVWAAGMENTLLPAVWWWIPLLVLLAFPASEWAVQTVHFAICGVTQSRPLLRLDYASGVPEDAATVVVIPVIWSQPEQVRDMAERLELHYLANRDPNIHYALLGDYKDADAEQTDLDSVMNETARSSIEALNRSYGEAGTTFHVLQRRRIWNESEGKWMGWERKRGKLVEFADLLRGAEDTSYFFHVGDLSKLEKVKYIITLDADTQLPIGTAQRMIGTIHLPYNRPRLNPAGTRVIEGYGVLQPRIGMSHESAMRSRFSRMWSGEPGIDPYSFAVSDPYHDAMEQGIFTGKGIFDVEVFRQVLGKRIPDNRVLSHDLLEGGFMRAGLLPDIELVDSHPPTYYAYQQRLHRWVRGDWQLLPWLGSSYRDRSGKRMPVDLTLLTRWQMLDNLRRSLLQPALYGLLLLAMLIPAATGLALLSIVLLTLAIPAIRSLLSVGRLLRRPRTFGAAASQAALGLFTLPYQTVLMLNAIAKTLYRLVFSKRRLLEWVSSAEVERRSTRMIAGLAGGLLLTAVLAAAALWSASSLQLAAGLLLAILWASAPLITRWLDQPVVARAEQLTASEREELTQLARQIWNFYEDYAGEQDNWLPPDNVQIDPPVGVAHRTSPTNIGLLLTVTVTARDFGFIDTPGMIERLERTVGTMERMEKWNGHLYNWYDTETLRPLPPVYVSTVDSGNLVGYLLAVKEGLAEWLRRDYEAGEEHEQGRRPAEPKREHGKQKNVAAASTSITPKLRPVTIDLELAEELTEGMDNSGIEASAELGMKHKGGAAAGTARRKGRSEWEERGRALIERLEKLAAGTDFAPLFDHDTKLFSLGYHVGLEQKEQIVYDLLASEARQASFIAIAMGQVPASHWFKLGRAMTKLGKHATLVSWTGTMFEYLMPPLIMKTYSGTLWDETYRGAVERQAAYARMRGVPMGISESGYYAFDYQMNYQYRAFGVPGLGFKRGLEQDLVLAPYATIMALPYATRTALEQLKGMEALGARGEYGYYEAVDCTAERMPKNRTSVVIRSFMAHHQGMALVTLGNLLLPDTMVDRFHADKRIRAVELLLQERVPEKPALALHGASASRRSTEADMAAHAPQREFTTPHTPVPEVCVLSNGVFTSVLNTAGSGYLRREGLALTRWREDPMADPWGSYMFIRDVESEAVWGPTYQPVRQEPQVYRAQFSLEKAKFIRQDGSIGTVLEVCVSPEFNAEIRKLTLTNEGSSARVLEVTTYMEVSLSAPAADDAHPAFSKLFVQTEYDEGHEALLAKRRPRNEHEKPVWAVHALAPCCDTLGPVEYETDRACFIGRGCGLEEPQSIRAKLSGTTGAVIDPAFVMRRRLTIGPGESVQLVAITGMADSREEALELPGRLCSEQQVERTLQLAWTRSQIELRHLHMKAQDAALYQGLAGRIIYTPPMREERAERVAANTMGQTGLWPMGISGDLPIALLLIRDDSGLSFAAQIIRGHEYLRRKGVFFDLVVLNESPGGYQQDIQDAIRRTVEQTKDHSQAGRQGGVYPVNSDQISEAEHTLLYTAARCILRADGRSLRAQLKAVEGRMPETLPLLAQAEAVEHAEGAVALPDLQSETILWNGWGGFTPDGKEYRIGIQAGRHLPAPWSNIMANPQFGCMVTELGTGYTWFRNSREFKLTPWSNDPVLDPAGEACYIRDESTGQYWSPAPSPAGGRFTYTAAHGHGYTRFESEAFGIAQTLNICVDERDPVKIMELTLRNTTGAHKQLSVTYYAEWVLGVRRELNASYITTAYDRDTESLMARNVFQETFREETAFLHIHADHSGPEERSVPVFTCSREEFIGRNGSMANPQAMRKRTLSGRTGPMADSCGALQLSVALPPQTESKVYIVLGCGRTAAEAAELARKYGVPEAGADAYNRSQQYWANALGQLQVDTPSREMNMLLNGWLLYQALACRMWARSAFYQAGGAYGYRDQLQDSLAMLHTRPDLTRTQIVLHARHQYLEGDVQHWWHAETERGIRTKYSDDLLWLPYSAARYIEHTGDATVLDEVQPYLTSSELTEEEHERYEPTVTSDESGTVYEHCLRAIDRAYRLGEHGLPLMGIGDWNDGMNSVGDEGRGESVWLGWFLVTVLNMFAPHCEARGDVERAKDLRSRAEALSKALNEHAWDGEWFRRAYTDHGDWLGTNSAHECRIDAIAQSWSVISHGAPRERSIRAMQSFDRELVDRGHDVAMLLTPAFDKTEPTPGYIQGYPPGIRENGGQYTHGVIWSIVAWAMLGDGDKAFELFNLMNPVNHTASQGDIRTYVGEPYVMAADVYMSDPYKGRAGWTWYTGASGWMYQAGVEWILGIRRAADRLYIRPNIPRSWPGFTADYRFGETLYSIHVVNGDAASEERKATGTGTFAKRDEHGAYIELSDDGQQHEVTVVLGGHA
ncbi:glycosyl transferase family 36 [Paenibacillus sambharensis]|uniref:Glycosyl transferase family 36 n=1 Tax=Paenibacillus sambharensis TaxID=1803190 RepID=A0A2W1L6X3_9BACL|nr:glucoamylase family protein [Paenibacillus sambharensis]PZD94703.1 glycosyl transferase family 36 [Paenibacillus sambharensis]